MAEMEKFQQEILKIQNQAEDHVNYQAAEMERMMKIKAEDLEREYAGKSAGQGASGRHGGDEIPNGLGPGFLVPDASGQRGADGRLQFGQRELPLTGIAPCEGPEQLCCISSQAQLQAARRLQMQSFSLLKHSAPWCMSL